MRHQRGYVYEASGILLRSVLLLRRPTLSSAVLQGRQILFSHVPCGQMLADEFMQSVNAGKVGNAQDTAIGSGSRLTCLSRWRTFGIQQCTVTGKCGCNI